MSELREEAVRSIFARHNKKVIHEVLQAIISATDGMTTEHFLRGCQELREAIELPENIGTAIRRLGRDNKTELVEKCCPRCLKFMDGKPMKDPLTGDNLPCVPGIRSYQKSTGTVYDKVGYITRCDCTASEKWAWMDEAKGIAA